tara:strand:+ start:599 stop:1021 length:423 start_codon:yes stop_codon:yes gene_type:complete
MKNPLKMKSNIAKKVIDYGASLLRKPKKTAPLTKKQDVYKQGMAKTAVVTGGPMFAAGMYVASDGKKPAPKKTVAKPVKNKKAKTVKLTPDQMPKSKPEKKMYMKEKYTGKDSNVEFKPLSVGGKVGGMKVGPATPNRLY